ncbi:MAG: alanyl-tRNA editing protein [Chloroflexi bacterium]|nr:alanyl-tRNA editing protein [Chloroflexota bacterium]
MAVRLYRDDSFLWHFSAHVCERVLHDGRPAVVLDRTAFYPTSGGQPFDFGSLNGVPVLEVIERDDGEIVHVLGATLEADEAQGEIDGARRIDHMQQHSGQHVLSGAFVTTANLDTLAVHIGAEECTIDLPATRLPPAALERAEDEANRIVFEDRPVIVRELSDAEAAALPLRKPPRVSGRIRIVEIEGFDWSACGGTHVRSSAQIGVIKITRAEKRGDMTRVCFRCGRRALQDYRALTEMAAALVEGFRVSRAEILPAIGKLREEARSARKALADTQARLFDYEAQELLRERAGAQRCVIARAYEGRDATALKLMAKRLTVEPGVVALLGGVSGGRAFLCFARSGDLSDDMGSLLRGALAVLDATGAKGGGSGEFAQGSGPAADVAVAQAALDWAATRLVH